MRWRPGICLGPHWGNSRRSPKLPSRLGRGNLPRPHPPSLSASIFQPVPCHFFETFRRPRLMQNTATLWVYSESPVKQWNSSSQNCIITARMEHTLKITYDHTNTAVTVVSMYDIQTFQPKATENTQKLERHHRCIVQQICYAS